MNERYGIAGAGNWIVDITKIIDVYPEQDTLANIAGQSSNNGGAPYNLLKDLARLGASFPLYAIGLVGNDDTGRRIIEDCRAHSIDTTQLNTTEETGTSYTDVMLVKKTGRRTFFHYRGANALFDLPHIDLKHLNTRILHLGYLLLLDRMDTLDEDGSTPASHLLETAGNQGFMTSVDLVSENSDRFAKIITPSLPFIDVLFCNEYEAGKLTGLSIDPDHPDLDTAKRMITGLLEAGVKKWIILHFPGGCMAGSKSGEFIVHGSVIMPEAEIVGTTGAGDAFAAGVLFGIHEGWPMKKCLELGVCTAAMSLTRAECSDGIKPKDACLELGLRYGYRKLT